MNQDKIELYLKNAQLFFISSSDTEQDTNELQNLIETHRLESQGNTSYESFFHGERCFYLKKYEAALKLYLQAQAVHQFNFFCFRTSAFLFDQLNNEAKSLEFAEKALKIRPEDYVTLSLIEKLKNGLKQEVLAIIEEKPSSSPIKSPVNNMEVNMNTDSDIFSSPKSLEPGRTQSLTERLYPQSKEILEKEPFLGKTPEGHAVAFEELKKLASHPNTEKEPFNRFMAAELGIDIGSGETLEKRIKSFQLAQTEIINEYLQQGKTRIKNPDYCLYYLNGWQNFDLSKKQYVNPLFLTEQYRRTHGGFFIRWNGKGIVINPGSQFLKNFHEQGLHIHDIDFVIVTDDRPESYADVKEIYDLNYQLNRVSQQLQIIHYYFNHKAFQELSRILKPHFKQERHTIHSLEIFLDSPDVEKVELSDGILLNYFQASKDVYANARDNKDDRKSHSLLGIRLDLKSHDKSTIRIGYIGNSAWNPLLSHHLGSCDLLMTSFGHTSSNDFNKISYNHDSLGYYGTFTLLEEIAPKLLLIGEYSGKEGDLRLEISQKMRNEYLNQVGLTHRQLPVIMPADLGLFLCLKTLRIHCSVSNSWVDPAQIRVTKTADSFGQLKYLSPSSCYQL